jgi:hypothetical protein
MKRQVEMTIDPEVWRKGKEIAGLIPFSRFVEDLLKKEISRRTRRGAEEHIGEGRSPSR